MYLEVEKRELKNKGIRYRVKISESYKENGKSKKRSIRNVGTCKDENEIEFLKRQGLKLIELELEKRNGPLLFDGSSSYDSCEINTPNVDFRKLKEEKRISEGVHEVYGTLFEDSGFSSILKGKQSKILKEIVLSRIEEPCSKRKTQEILERDCNFKTSLDSIYRMVTALSKRADFLIKTVAQQTQSLFSEKIDVVFFDISTLYFESTIQDELRDFGYSKDNKFKETQVVLALAATREGLPIGYKVFPGKTAETKTLVECLNLPGKLIICRSQSRAKKDQADREKLVNKIKKVIGKTKADAKKLITNKGYLKFTNLSGQTISSLNEKKIEEDQKWDGIFGLFTNAELTEEEILQKYRGLWQIELAFRLSKNDLAMRPIFHRKKERIEGHIAICFMALFLMKKCQLLLERNKVKLFRAFLRCTRGTRETRN